MIYPTDKKNKKYFISVIIAIFLIVSVFANTVNALDSDKRSKDFIQFDFGTQPLGISQTTREFYLCASDSEENQMYANPKITIVEKNKVKKKHPRPSHIHRWNIPDSRSRVNMNRWLKKTRKNQIAIHIDSPYITGDNPNAFKIQDNQCNKNKLLPGTTCEFDVSFLPKNEGKQRANIVIPYSHKGVQSYYMVHVTGSAQKKAKTKMALIH
jgi:hypothetical protein